MSLIPAKIVTAIVKMTALSAKFVFRQENAGQTQSVNGFIAYGIEDQRVF